MNRGREQQVCATPDFIGQITLDGSSLCPPTHTHTTGPPKFARQAQNTYAAPAFRTLLFKLNLGNGSTNIIATSQPVQYEVSFELGSPHG